MRAPGDPRPPEAIAPAETPATPRQALGAGAAPWAFYACGLGLVGFGALAWHAQWTDDFRLFMPAALAQCAVYALATWLLVAPRRQSASEPPAIDARPTAPWTTRPHTLLMVIFGVAVILRLIAFSTPPNFLSTDIYRYVWDGRVQAAGINPYLYVPADPALASLRDEAIYSHINRIATAPTIYAPFAQVVFLAVTRLGESVAVMRLGMLAFEVVAVVALGLLLRRLGLPLRRLALYLWHPLPIWEIACGGHVDAVLTAATLLALVAATAGRRGLAGALLGLATLTKFFPLVLAPAIWRRWDWKAPAGFVVTLVVFYAAYSGAGWKVFGYLFGYASEEGLDGGNGIFWVVLLRHLGLPGTAAFLVYAVIAVAVMAWLAARAMGVMRAPSFSRLREKEPLAPRRADEGSITERNPPSPGLRSPEVHPLQRAGEGARSVALGGVLAAAALATATTTLIAPHYAWYFVWLVPFIVISPRPSLLWLTSAVFALYVADWPMTVPQAAFIYGPFLLLLVAEQFWLVSPSPRAGILS